MEHGRRHARDRQAPRHPLTSARDLQLRDREIGIELMLMGMAWACVVGFIGGLMPAIRAARLPVADALRAV